MGKRIEPASKWVLITNSDTVQVPADVRSLYIVTSGDLVLTGIDDVDATFPVVAGQIVPCQPKLVKATGSTATAIALYG